MKKPLALILVLAAAGLVLILMVRGGMTKEAMLKGATKMESYYRGDREKWMQRTGTGDTGIQSGAVVEWSARCPPRRWIGGHPGTVEGGE